MIADALTARLKIAALQLQPIEVDVVFVGGSVMPLLLTDQGARDVRNTDDIDVVVAIASKPEWYALQQKLIACGFKPAGGGPICRFVNGPLTLDVMPTDATVLGFGNRWYHETMATAQTMHIDDIVLRIIAAPCFVAAKLEAYAGRGNDDFMVSHDIEDIVAVLDGRASLMQEVAAASVALRSYLADTMTRLLHHRHFAEGLEGHVAGEARRADNVERIWRTIAAGV